MDKRGSGDSGGALSRRKGRSVRLKKGVQRSEVEAGVNNQLFVDYDYLRTMRPSLWTFRQKRKAFCILTVGTGPRLDEEIRYSFLRTMPRARLCSSPQ